MKRKGSQASGQLLIYIDRNFRKNEIATAENQMFYWQFFFFFDFLLEHCVQFSSQNSFICLILYDCKALWQQLQCQKSGWWCRVRLFLPQVRAVQCKGHKHNRRVEIMLSRLVSLRSVLCSSFTKQQLVTTSLKKKEIWSYRLSDSMFLMAFHHFYLPYISFYIHLLY